MQQVQALDTGEPVPPFWFAIAIVFIWFPPTKYHPS